MSLIGFDCNGKPLYAGDRCVLLESDPQEPALRAGMIVQVSAKHKESFVTISIELAQWDLVAVNTEILRKLPKDQHRSADRSFEDMMRGLKTLMPESNHL
ncbi:hypothetical protein [Marinobacter salarius]|uniref:hypothetical protein n=1 Tax=Marinobacter salarius TaxID=1420917 RepID=UPI003D0EA5B0